MQGSLTDAEAQALILAEVNDADGVVAAQIAAIWALYSDLAQTQRLRYFYALRDAIRVLQGAMREHVQFAVVGDIEMQAQQKFTHLATMHDAVLAEIRTLETRTRSARAPLVSTLTRISPIEPPLWLLDANNADYTGNPYAGATESQR